MTEHQAETLIKLLTEISDKLTDISQKISSDYQTETMFDILNNAVSALNSIDSNTAND